MLVIFLLSVWGLMELGRLTGDVLRGKDLSLCSLELFYCYYV